MPLIKSPLRRVWLQRHYLQVNPINPTHCGWDTDASLAVEALEVAAKVREFHLKGVVFKDYIYSGMKRTRQSLDLNAPPHVDRTTFIVAPEIHPRNLDEWGWYPEMAKAKGTSAQACWETAPDILRAEGKRLGDYVTSRGLSLSSGENVLLNSHGPLCESCIAELTGEWGPRYNFKKGDIGVFCFDASRLVEFYYLPIPA
ncbi:hypothetical protein HY971_02370 [Candidatus Kaiserbacteria bacterium]|nr:hypothetical protein [Candidatus Kaiserbacteria bacterium]